MAGSGLILEEPWGSRQPGGASPRCLAQWAVSSHCGKLRQRRQGAVGVNALLLPISHPNPEYRPQAMSWTKPPSLSHVEDLRTSKELLLGQHRVGDAATSHGAVVSEVICQRLLGLQPHQTF